MKVRIRVEHGVLKRVIAMDLTRGAQPCGCFVRTNGRVLPCVEHKTAWRLFASDPLAYLEAMDGEQDGEWPD
jgi:hypothetical protein